MELLINVIIRPPRAEYDPNNDLLDQKFMLKSKLYQRKDLEVTNSRGDVLQCSHYMPVIPPEGKELPCVIYCHGNSGCRTDASEAAVILLPSNITVFTLDFSGSGLSGGEHVTLGWNEKDDLRAVVDYLRADGTVSLIGLWGRSMGAVTSLMYGAEDPSIAGMVLDSPFSDLVDLMMELVDSFKIRLPKFSVKFAIQYMRKAIQRKAKFDIMELNTIKVAKSCFVPVLFGHAIEDNFIQPHHSDRIFDVYVGDKNIIKFEGNHNCTRPNSYFDSVRIFFKNVLQPPENDGANRYFDLSHDYFTGVPADISTKDNQPDSEAPSGNISVEGGDSDAHSLTSKDSPRGSVDDDESVEYLDMLEDFPNNAEDEEERMLKVAIYESLKDLQRQRQTPPPPNKESDAEILFPSTHPSSSKVEASKTSGPSVICNHRPSDVDMVDPTKVVEKNPTANIIDGFLRRWDIFRNRYFSVMRWENAYAAKS